MGDAQRRVMSMDDREAWLAEREYALRKKEKRYERAVWKLNFVQGYLYEHPMLLPFLFYQCAWYLCSLLFHYVFY